MKGDNSSVTLNVTSRMHELSTHGEQICFIVLGFAGIHFLTYNYLFPDYCKFREYKFYK